MTRCELVVAEELGLGPFGTEGAATDLSVLNLREHEEQHRVNDAPIFDPYSHLLAEQLGPVVFVAQGIVDREVIEVLEPTLHHQSVPHEPCRPIAILVPAVHVADSRGVLSPDPGTDRPRRPALSRRLRPPRSL